jgi:hypothetical protein
MPIALPHRPAGRSHGDLARRTREAPVETEVDAAGPEEVLRRRVGPVVHDAPALVLVPALLDLGPRGLRKGGLDLRIVRGLDLPWSSHAAVFGFASLDREKEPVATAGDTRCENPSWTVYSRRGITQGPHTPFCETRTPAPEASHPQLRSPRAAGARPAPALPRRLPRTRPASSLGPHPVPEGQ